MSAPNLRSNSEPTLGRIVGLFPELLGVGGVQEAGRMTATALTTIANVRGASTQFLALNDAAGPHTLPAAPEVQLRGFARAKVAFTIAALRQARATRTNGRAASTNGIVLAAHPNLARPAAWMHSVAPKLRTIVIVHGIEVWKPLPGFRRRALAGADFLLAPSRYTAQKLIDVQRIAPERVRVLPWPLGSNFLRFADSPAALPLPPQFPSGQIILTVGRWASTERYKGLDELIAAIAALSTTFPQLQLVAVGGGDDLPRLRQLAADRGVAARVHFIEGITREQTAACYSHADIFALPSTGEGFGLVFLEAMAFAKPIVGVAAAGATDVFEDGVNGLLPPPGEAASHQQALARLLGSESLRREPGLRGSQIVRDKYAFAIFQKKLEHILDECELLN
jgi:glycosyltransferase involved in cell wall biosynthesis